MNNLVWNKFYSGDRSTYPPKYGNYFVIQGGKLIMAYFEIGDFYIPGDITMLDQNAIAWFDGRPTHWAEMPKYNLPDEVLLDSIK